MAEQEGVIAYSGKMGRKIGFRRNGKYYVRSAPEIVVQSAASIRASRRFGWYSTKARLVRHAFYAELDVRSDSTHINRLNKVLIDARGNHHAIRGFRFNQDACIDRFFTVMPELSRDGVVHIPEQYIVQHRDIATLEVKVMAVRIDFYSRQVTETDMATLTIDPQTPFCGTDIPLSTGREGTLVITMQVKGIRKDGSVVRSKFLAADVIAVVDPEAPEYPKVHTHPGWEAVTSETMTGQAYITSCQSIVQRE